MNRDVATRTNVNEANAGDGGGATMTARVVDRSGWGHCGPYPVIRAVTIDATCPKCGGPRGRPYPYRFHEDGDWLTCDRWDNPCGHIDKYDDVLAEVEAAMRGNA
jgi:hypothetical protein